MVIYSTACFEYYGVELSKGKIGTIKQSLSFNTLEECERREMTIGTKLSLMPEMVYQNTVLRKKVEDLTTALGKKDAKVIELREINAQMSKKVKSLTHQLLEAHRDHSGSMSRLTQSLASKSSSSQTFCLYKIFFSCLYPLFFYLIVFE